MTSFQPVNGKTYNLQQLIDNRVDGFTHYGMSVAPGVFVSDNSREPRLNYYNFRYNDDERFIDDSRHGIHISPDSTFEYRNGHYYPKSIIASDIEYPISKPRKYETTTPIEGTRYYQTTYTDDKNEPRTNIAYLSEYDSNSRQFRPIIVTDETGGRYRVLPSSELLQDGSNHFSRINLSHARYSNRDASKPHITFIGHDDGSYHKILGTNPNGSYDYQHYDFNPDTNQLTKSKPKPLEPHEMIDDYVDQKLDVHTALPQSGSSIDQTIPMDEHGIELTYLLPR